MAQFSTGLTQEEEVANWDTMMGANYGGWESPPAAPIAPDPSPADAMYAPAPDLSFQQPYQAPAPDPAPPDAGSAMYAPAPELSYQQPYEVPAPAYSEPMQDPFAQMAYAPAPVLQQDPWAGMQYDPQPLPELGGNYYSGGTPFDASPSVQPYDPSLGAQFGFGATGSSAGLTDAQAAQAMFGTQAPDAFFNNPQYAASDAQFDYTTDPANRNGVGLLGGIQNLVTADWEIKPLAQARDVARDVGTYAGNLVDPYGFRAPTASGYTGGQQDTLLGKGLGGIAAASVPTTPLDIALYGAPLLGKFAEGGIMAERGFGMNLDTLPDAGKALGGAVRGDWLPGGGKGFFSGVGGTDDASRQVFNTLSDVQKAELAAMSPEDAAKAWASLIDSVPQQGTDAFTAARQTLEDRYKGMKLGEIRADLESQGYGDAIVTNKGGTMNRQKTFDAVIEKATGSSPVAGDVAGQAARAPIDTELQAAIDRGVASGQGVPKSRVAASVSEDAIGRTTRFPVAEADLSDESKAIVQHYIDNFSNTKITETPWRGTTSKIGGDVANPDAARIIGDQDSLFRQVVNSEVKTAKAQAARDAALVTDPEVAKSVAQLNEMALHEGAIQKGLEASDLYMKNAVEKYAKDDPLRAMRIREALVKAKAEEDDIRYKVLKALADAQQPLKEAVLGGDVSTLLQQDLRFARMGTTSAVTNVFRNFGELAASKVGKGQDFFAIYTNAAISHRQQAIADGLIQMGAEAVGLTRPIIENSNATWAGKLKLPWTAYKKFNDAQFGIVDKLRLQAYEGRLWQEKLLGNDITNPSVRRAAADFANTAGSTARVATAPIRREAERALALSAPMRRAQFAELAQPLKAFTSRTQATNFINQVASTAATLGVAYEVQKNFGPDPGSFKDFLEQSFNPDNPKMIGRFLIGKGQSDVMTFLPQFTLERAILNSISHIREPAKLGEDWLKFGFGSLNLGLTMPLNVLGWGYDNNGGFHTGDMNMTDSFKQAAPLPISAKDVALYGERDPRHIVANAIGGQAWSESTYNLQDRVAKEMFGQEFSSLDPVDKAATYAKMAADGNPPEKGKRNDPYEKARDFAWDRIKAGNEEASQYATIADYKEAYVEYWVAKGTGEAEAKKKFDKYLLTITDSKGRNIDALSKEVRRQVVEQDPDIVDSLSNPSQEMIDYAKQIKAQKGK